MPSATPTLTVVQHAFERAGVHPHVGLQIQRVDRNESFIEIDLELSYVAPHPICCAEPACYIPALRPTGLATVSEQIRAEELLDDRPALRVNVTARLEPGFEFLEPAMGCKDGARMLFHYPAGPL